MGYDVEDEIDWSDGSLGPKSPPPSEPVLDAITTDQTAEEPYQQSTQFEDASHEQWHLPFGEPLPLGSAGVRRFSKFGLSRSQRSRVGVHFNRREPTKEDYANHVLYQANQKTYEAVFLKTFINHALHPDQLGSILPHDDDHARVKRYLQTVSNSVNHIVTKMVWNAHSRTVNFLANDGKQSVHFWDFQQFDKGLFNDFYPENAIPVVHQMHESWHRAFDPPPMVRYTTKDYPIGKHCSPFEEIDAVAGTLFSDKTKVLYTGRAVKPLSKKNKDRSSLGAATRPEIEIDTRGNWLHGLIALPNPDSKPNPSLVADVRRVSHALSDKGVSLGKGKIYSEAHHGSDPTTYIEKRPKAGRTYEERSPLEMFIDRYSPDVLRENLGATPRDEEGNGQKPKAFAWRTRLIEDHTRRLTAKWPRSQQRTQGPDLDIKAVVEQAVARGFLKPPDAEVREKIDVAARIEQRKILRTALQQRKLAEASHNAEASTQPLSKDTPKTKKHKQSKGKTMRRVESVEPPKKKRKIGPTASGVVVHPEGPVPLPPHPSGSNTLEPHQMLPPDAYFERTYDDEKPVWRCGIKHAMGYYYNAGDRKNCVGCFTSIDHNPRLKWMDFYLPSRSYFHQAAPGVIWNPSKQYVKARRSKHLSHNSIAKEAFWDAINTGSNADVARRRAIEAVEKFLRPKTPPREPTPELKPEPVDLGPHPSGSKMMEHGQDIPECAYWEKKERGDEFAWRCDVNHALGRYYLSGNKRSCPGCGSNKVGSGKHAEMDFYLPDGVIVRQDAPGLVKWHPRKPYNITRTGKRSKCRGKQTMTHNQICSKKYWDAIEAGQVHEEALASAIADTDAFLDAKNEEVRIKQEELQAEHDASRKEEVSEEGEDSSVSGDRQDEAATTRSLLISSVPRKRGNQEFSEGEMEEVEEYESGHDTSRPTTEVTSRTSSDESTSGSDSE